MKKKYMVVLVMIAVAGIALWSKMSVLPKGGTEAVNSDLGIPIEVVEVNKERLIETISYVGTIGSKDTVQITAKMPLEIKELSIQEGEYVKAGAIIGRLDDRDIQAKIATLQAKIDTVDCNLDYLTKEEARYHTLYQQGALPESSYDKIKHEKDMAQMQQNELKAMKRELEVSLENTVLRSPMDGIVRTIHYSVGDLSTVGKPVAVVDDLSEVLVEVNLPESDLNRVNQDTPVWLKVPGREGKIQGHIQKILPSMNPKTRIGTVEIRMENLENPSEFLMGASAEVEFVLNESEEGITIPIDAVKTLGEEVVVYRIENKVAKQIKIKTGMKVGEKVQVLEGLAVGEKIGIGNMDKLYDGAKVYVFKGEEQS